MMTWARCREKKFSLPGKGKVNHSMPSSQRRSMASLFAERESKKVQNSKRLRLGHPAETTGLGKKQRLKTWIELGSRFIQPVHITEFIFYPEDRNYLWCRDRILAFTTQACPWPLFEGFSQGRERPQQAIYSVG